MLLLNKTLLHMAKGLWGWILSITAAKLVVLVGTAWFAQSIGEIGRASCRERVSVQV